MTDHTFADEIAAKTAPRPKGFYVSAEHKSLRGFAVALNISLFLYVLVCAALLGLVAYGLWFIDQYTNVGFTTTDEFLDAASLIDRVARALNVASVTVQILCVVTYCLFIYNASINLHRADAKGHTIGPDWSVGWSFIPFINLFKIYQVMRQIWSASRNPRNPARGAPMFMAVWWIFYVGADVLAFIAVRRATAAFGTWGIPDTEELTRSMWIDIAAASLGLISGILLIAIVSGITSAQRKWRNADPEAPPA